jgi:hypothetical protein
MAQNEMRAMRGMPLRVPSMGMRRDFPPSGNGDDAPRLVVFKVINLQPVKEEVPWTKLSEKAPCG